jgi:DNA recombination protein RmuC
MGMPDRLRSIADLLTPLRDRLAEFEAMVQRVHHSEAKDRSALSERIDQIVKTSNRMTQETATLTSALRGSVKAQGCWGEVMLERILETSGLSEGTDYTREGKGLNIVNDEGAKLRPDALVHLPGGKSVVVDAKVSLIAYERYVAAADDNARAEAAEELARSLASHVKGLAAKHYAAHVGAQSPEMVLMFTPIEAAFSIALQHEPTLWTEAWEKRVVIVSPTTLLATLWAVAASWKAERQNNNVLEIAVQGGKLYDKLATFVEELDKVGKHLGAAQQAFTGARQYLATGKGNVLRQAELLRQLGAKTKKSLPATGTDAADEEAELALLG